MKGPAATIAIPTYNRAPQLSDTLRCMVRQQTGFPYEILVINDGSTDETPKVINRFAREYPVPVRCITERGCGYTHALNRAVDEFQGTWLAFFDDDQLAGPGWLAGLMRAAEEQDALMVGGPVILDIPEETLNRLGPVCRDIFGESPDVRDPERYAHRPPLPSGGNRLVHRKVFERVGTFDEKMLTGGCDRDFLLRALAAGIPMGWAPKSAAHHVISTGRFTYQHIKWYSLQWGCSFAYTDFKHKGRLFTAAACCARVGQALLINLPRLGLSRAAGKSAAVLDRQALLWRAAGYARKTLQLLAPDIFPQEKFFSRVEFRRVRESAETG